MWRKNILYLVYLFLFALGANSTVHFADKFPTPFTPNNKVLGVILNFNFDHTDPVALIINEFVSMCEGGWDPKIVFLTTVERSDLVVRFMAAKAYCYRVGRPILIETSYHDRAIGVGLSAQNRVAIKQNKDEYDVFIYLEDDMVFKYSHLVAYLAELKLLLAVAPSNFLESNILGFQRYRRLRRSSADVEHNSRFEEDQVFQQDYLEELPNLSPICVNSTPYLLVTGNIHQGMFALIKQQLTMLEEKCNFLNMSWPSREFQSSFSLFDHKPHYCAMNKLLPAEQLSTFAIYHYYEQRHVSWTPLFGAAENIKAGYTYNSEGPVRQRQRMDTPSCWQRIVERAKLEQYPNAQLR